MDAPKKIWAGRVDGFGGWHEAPDIVNKTPYILETEVAKLVAEAEARGMERAAGLFTAKPWTWNAHEIQEKIRAEAAAIRRAAEGMGT